MSFEMDQTIAALSTPAGESGIAVVRVSGAGALGVLSGIFRTRSGSSHTGEWEHRRLYHGLVSAPNGEIIDDVICAVMRAPESYTGEDTVEISSHGNTLLVSRILESIFKNGARPALPGEFTKRAFLNGKLDLIQAEAVADLIHSRSELQRSVAREQLSGTLSRRVNELGEEMLELLSLIEANIDFIEEGIETIDYVAAAAVVERQQQRLGALLSSAAFIRPFREGYRVVVAGPVNAGKSSLFNKLVGENRAIVTEIPGTTRDVLREPIVLEGMLFILQDTAGLRGTTDRVERIGVSLAESTVEDADAVLFVVDASEPLDDESSERLRRADAAKTIIIANKIDLPVRFGADRLGAISPGVPVIRASSLTGEGIRDIERAVVSRAARDGLSWIARERVILNARIAAVLTRARDHLAAVKTGLVARAPIEILAFEAREVLSCYEVATGKRYTEDLLDTIFSRFCIGK
jgi:tRNA modification GTPase